VAALRRACEDEAAIVAVTSAEVLAALLEMVPEAACPRLKHVALLVPGDRVAGAARELGWRGRIVAAPSAEDAAMAGALGRAFAGGSGTGAA
jgi:uroporphyrinogen-III synthase